MRSLALTILLGFFVVIFGLYGNLLSVNTQAAPSSKTNSMTVYDDPVSDYYLTEYGTAIHMPIADNDGASRPGWGNMEFTNSYIISFLANQGTFYQFFSFNPIEGAPRVEWFTYRYRTNDDEPYTYTATADVGIGVIPNDDAQNAGRVCHSVGQPVNVTNGNMWIEERDYILPGPGEPIEINRFYNSVKQTNGLFGLGWSTQYDESLEIYSDNLFLRLNLPDGKASYFGRTNTSNPFEAYSQNVFGQIVKNGDGTYTLNFKDGRIHKFNSSGKLLWQKDRNGLQTTLNYDGSGFLTGVTDAVGRTLTITLNGAGNVSQISDALSTVATYEYYASTNKLKTVTYNDGSKYQFEYTTISSKIYLTTVKDALANVLETHAYDSSGRATTSEKDGGVEAYTFDYTDPGMTLVTDARGKVSKYYFTRKFGTNLVTQTEGVCSCGGSGSEITQYLYDLTSSRLNLVKITDALTRETDYTYNNNRDVTSVTDVLGTQSFTYNSRGQVLTHTDRMSGVTTNTYSTNGNLLTTTDRLNNTTTLTYTSLGQLDTFTDALSHATDLTYDSYGRLTQITDANAKNTSFAYDARARVTSITNALSQVTSVEYDSNNRVNKIIFPDTNYITAAYDLAGRQTTKTDELGHSTTFAYDNAYRLTSVTDALSHATSFGYDLMSNLTSQTDALGNVTDLEYDDFNRLKKIKYPLPVSGGTRLEENYTYDLVGNTKTRVDTGGRTTTYDYDTANRLIKITDPLSQLTQFTYNARSQTTKVKDASNQEYTYTYDAMGRVLTQTRNSQTTTFTYDEVGNRETREDYIGNDTTYTYDVLNRLTNVAYSGASGENATYTYDDLSRMLTAVNGTGTVTFTYDNRDRLKTETDVFGQVLEYGYDAASRKTSLKLNSSTHTSYAYDNADRLTTLTDETSANWTFAYDNANRRTSQAAPNGITSTYEYDGMSRLKRLKHILSGSSLYDFQYTYNSANQISQIASLAGTKTNTYDNIDRLTDVSSGGSSIENYTYDAVGNRTASHLSASYTTGTFNKLTATTAATYSYNNNGSMTGKTVGATTWTYGWDRENRMISAGNGTSTASYEYDALGRRVKRTQGSTVEKYTHDGQDVVRDDVNSAITTYQNGPGIDNKLKFVNSSTGAKYYMQDHLGSTIGTANASGIRRDANTYDSFGNPSDTTYRWRHQFTGRERDPLTGMQFSRARFYDPQIGRFVSEDPIGFGGGDVNLYGYVWNNPGNYTDPMGLDGWGSNAADWLDKKIDYARRFYKGDVEEWKRNGTVDTVADLAKAAADALRVGQGLGCALFADGLHDFERFDYVAADVVRAGTIFTALAGVGARFVPKNKGVGNPFKGKTAPEIDAMFKNKGFTTSGPDPISGNGGYVNPKTGRSYHIDPKEYGKYREPNHVDVNRPRDYRGNLEKKKFDYREGGY
jgi:RHS repeat-associated protein